MPVSRYSYAKERYWFRWRKTTNLLADKEEREMKACRCRKADRTAKWKRRGESRWAESEREEE